MQEKNLDEFITKLESTLPDLVTNEILLNSGIGGSNTSLFRFRERHKLPFLKLSSCRILYLKKDVLDWVRKCYNDPEYNKEASTQPTKTKKPSKRSNKLCGAIK